MIRCVAGEFVPRVPHREQGGQRDPLRSERFSPAAGPQLRQDIADLPDQASKEGRAAVPFDRDEGERASERKLDKERGGGGSWRCG